MNKNERHKLLTNIYRTDHIQHRPGPALASAGPDWKHFFGTHLASAGLIGSTFAGPRVCRYFWGGHQVI